MAAVIARLYELGFAAGRTTDSAAERQWYRHDEVGELSREEAAVIAQRVVPAFARANDLPDRADTLTDLVAMTLHRCFVTNVVHADSPLGTLHGECGRAVEEGTRAQLGAARASELGKAVRGGPCGGEVQQAGFVPRNRATLCAVSCASLGSSHGSRRRQPGPVPSRIRRARSTASSRRRWRNWEFPIGGGMPFHM